MTDEAKIASLQELLAAIRIAMHSDNGGCDWSHMIKAIDEALQD